MVASIDGMPLVGFHVADPPILESQRRNGPGRCEGKERSTMREISLQKVSGACAILTVIVVIVGFTLFATTDVSDSGDAVENLPAIDADKGIVAASSWLLTLAPILLLGTIPGLFRALRGAGDVIWIAVLASITGGFLLIPSTLIELAVIYEIATPYVEAGPEAGAELLVLADALLSVSLLSRIIGDVIFTGIGGLLFSLAILQTGFAPKWVGWLGLIAAVGHWFFLMSEVSVAFELIYLVGEIAFFLWLVAIGVVLLRAPRESAAA